MRFPNLVTHSPFTRVELIADGALGGRRCPVGDDGSSVGLLPVCCGPVRGAIGNDPVGRGRHNHLIRASMDLKFEGKTSSNVHLQILISCTDVSDLCEVIVSIFGLVLGGLQDDVLKLGHDGDDDVPEQVRSLDSRTPPHLSVIAAPRGIRP